MIDFRRHCSNGYKSRRAIEHHTIESHIVNNISILNVLLIHWIKFDGLRFFDENLYQNVIEANPMGEATSTLSNYINVVIY